MDVLDDLVISILNEQIERGATEDEILAAFARQVPEMKVEDTIRILRNRVRTERKEIRAMERRRAEVWRERGAMNLYDMQLFAHAIKSLKLPKDVPLEQAMKFLRYQRRRGPKQQEALEIWDKHYAHLEEIWMPDEKAMLELDAEFDRREAAR